MSQRKGLNSLVVLLCVLILVPSATAHEQETLNVILVEDEARPGNVTDSAFVEGNSIVFRMRDNTENSSMRVSIDNNQNGNFSDQGDNVSTWLTRTCDLDDNGSLADDGCAVSYERIFNSTSQGTYHYQIERKINDSVVDVWQYNITVHPDIHAEPGQPSIGDCFGTNCADDASTETQSDSEWDSRNTLIAVMVFAAFGTVVLTLSIRKERLIRGSDSNEEE